MKDKDIQRYMKFSEAMKYLNLKSYQSLHKFIDDGLRVVSVGDTKRIDRVDADKFMEAHKTNSEMFQAK
ncbi:helix-turn-helix domain-containing protein [Gluconobacter oxydans]|uniref:helix-turn-helix domain-containing protein n=1 Tax=Gluconobacter oxydans TaxID=442 RepID=UPI0020A1A7CA|nr:helix-turn-helix domain-containing protein [Gluconobacter oxydans]MCP1250143.1 helix-turn-helix domain-containing protein [Gluconobacter oxydans]